MKLYRQVLKEGGQIHFKTDNQPLFEFSVEEIPQFGFELSEVTRNLHENGPVGVMTDYEAKFHELGQPINRCVATMVPWEEPFPTDPEIVARAAGWIPLPSTCRRQSWEPMCWQREITSGTSSPGTWFPASAKTRPGRH